MRPELSSRRNRAGFTLIELMVVITIIGIVTAVMIPEMKGSYQDALLRSTSRELINAFDLAYSRAVSLNQGEVVVVFFHCWLLPPLQAHCSTFVPSAVPLPVTSRHLPLFWLTIL